MQTNLPPGAKTALEEVAKLARNTLQNLVKILRAAVITVSPATGKQMDNALSDGVAAPNTVKDHHGFSIVQGANGKDAVQFNKGGRLFWISQGYVRDCSKKLEPGGDEELNRIQLRSDAEFRSIMEDHLIPAVTGLIEINGVLKTDDAALNLAYLLVKLGGGAVSTYETNAFVNFTKKRTESGLVVSGGFVCCWSQHYDFTTRGDNQFYGPSTPESNN